MRYKKISRSLRLTLTKILAATLIIGLGGCTDPYEKKLPHDGLLTAGEAEKIAQTLAAPDQVRFKHWAERMLRKERYGGEPSAVTVKHALLNQAEFDLRQEKVEAETAAKNAEKEKLFREQARVEREKQAELERLGALRAAVNGEIREHFLAQALSYEIRPVFNRYGEEFSRQWVFKLKLTNLSSKTIIGAAGWANVSDVFGNAIGSYPMRIEPQVAPGKSIEYPVVMDHNKKDPRHLAMAEANRLVINWFFESVAFSDGSIIDQKAITEAQGKAPVTAQTKPGTL